MHAGVPANLPHTRPAAQANSSATASRLTRNSYPCGSRNPRWSCSAFIPATPMAASVNPSRHARPQLSQMITGTEIFHCFFRARRSFAAERSASLGSSSACLPPSTLETSTPLFAQMNPCRVSVINTPRLRRITFFDCCSANSVTRASTPYRLAQAREAREVRIFPKLTNAPSAFETTLCFTTRMSPDCIRKPVLLAAATIFSLSESPFFISP